jgi:hypothetical protein
MFENIKETFDSNEQLTKARDSFHLYKDNINGFFEK